MTDKAKLDAAVVEKARGEAAAISAVIAAAIAGYGKAHGGVPAGSAFLACVYEVCLAARMAGVSRDDLLTFVGNGFDDMVAKAPASRKTPQ